MTDSELESLISALKDGIVTSETITKRYLTRIDQVNEIVNAVCQINPTAVDDAKSLDVEKEAHKSRGLFHGIPVLLKDTITTLGELDTTAGSLALKGARASEEATVVKILRDSGAVILGKTSVTEWSNSRDPRAPNGWSPTHGQCYGAYYGRQDPNGSSAGSAVAASMGLAPISIAVETWGSIGYPARQNGVVGLKPTVGLVSRAGLVPVSAYKDSVGMHARTVKDAAIILSVIAGRDSRDEATKFIPFDTMPDFVSACKLDALSGKRIAISQSTLRTVSNPEIMASFIKALELMGSEEAYMVDQYDFKTWTPDRNQREDLPDNVYLREGLEAYFQKLEVNPHNIRTMSDLINFMEATPGEETEKWGLDGFIHARDEPHISSSPEFKAAVQRMQDQGSEIQRLLDKANCDALVIPTYADVPFDLGQNPMITVPLGFFSANTEKKVEDGMVRKAENIPYSISFIGRKFDDETIIGLAYAFEQATKDWPRPRLCVQPTIDVLPEG